MSTDPLAFKSGVIRPMECWSAGWQLIKDQYWLLVGITLVGTLLGSVAPMAILIGPMMCGVYLVLLTLMRGERIEFGLLFKGFDYFIPSLIATLVQMVPVLAVIGPATMIFFVTFAVAGAASSGSRNGAPVAAGVLIVGVGLFVLLVLALVMATTTFFLFIHALVVDRKLSGWDACKTSFNAVRANLGGALGLAVLNLVSGWVGALLCYVGLFLVMPLQFAAVAVAYRQVFPDLGTPLLLPAQAVGQRPLT